MNAYSTKRGHVDERTLQAAAAAVERDWLKSATLKELELLELSGERLLAAVVGVFGGVAGAYVGGSKANEV